jgi:hypothetical protein
MPIRINVFAVIGGAVGGALAKKAREKRERRIPRHEVQSAVEKSGRRHSAREMRDLSNRNRRGG